MGYDDLAAKHSGLGRSVILAEYSRHFVCIFSEKLMIGPEKN